MGDSRLRWDDIEIFCLLAEFRSIRQTASQCGQSVETVRRRINALEVSLGERLFRRTAHGLTITQAGEEILGEAQRAREAVLSISRMAGAEASKSRRTLRISAPEDLGAIWLAPALHRMMVASSRCTIECDFHLPGAQPDWTRTDIALLFEKPTNANLICRKIGALRYGMFKRRQAETGLDRAGDRMTVSNASIILPENRHPYVQLLLASEYWSSPIAYASMRLDSAVCRLSILRSTNALTPLPALESLESADIVSLPEWIAPTLDVDLWLVFHDDIRRAAGARAVLDAVGSLVSNNADLCLGARHLVK